MQALIFYKSTICQLLYLIYLLYFIFCILYCFSIIIIQSVKIFTLYIYIFFLLSDSIHNFCANNRTIFITYFPEIVDYASVSYPWAEHRIWPGPGPGETLYDDLRCSPGPDSAQLSSAVSRGSRDYFHPLSFIIATELWWFTSIDLYQFLGNFLLLYLPLTLIMLVSKNSLWFLIYIAMKSIFHLCC